MQLGLLSLLVSFAPGAAAPAPAGGIERLAWMQGCWELKSADRTVEEQWMVPRGRTMLGASRTVRGERLVAFELVVLREQGDQLAYEAHPSGQPGAVFLSSSIAGDSVLFENPKHDFPQKVGYRRAGRDALLAFIEGPQQGKTKRIEYPFKRATCPGAVR